MNYSNVNFEKAVGTEAQLPVSDLPEICFAGRSNVGKSSLLNRLFNRKALARTSAKPGKTVTVNFFVADGVRFADLPGYGYAKVAFAEKQRWSGLMEGYFAQGRDLRLAVQLVDMRHPPTADDIDMLQYLIAAGTPFAVALTKSDKLNKTERAARLEALKTELAFLPAGVEVFPFSAQTGEGVEFLKQLIEQRIA